MTKSLYFYQNVTPFSGFKKCLNSRTEKVTNFNQYFQGKITPENISAKSWIESGTAPLVYLMIQLFTRTSPNQFVYPLSMQRVIPVTNKKDD